jgi:cell division protein FtsB
MSLVKSKARPKRKLSPIQEARFFKILVVVTIVAILWIVFAPSSGLWAIWKKHGELNDLQRQNAQIEDENGKLQKDIERLQNDPKYLEEVARKEHNLLKKNERIFEFAPKKSTKEK